MINSALALLLVSCSDPALLACPVSGAWDFYSTPVHHSGCGNIAPPRLRQTHIIGTNGDDVLVQLEGFESFWCYGRQSGCNMVVACAAFHENGSGEKHNMSWIFRGSNVWGTRTLYTGRNCVIEYRDFGVKR